MKKHSPILLLITFVFLSVIPFSGKAQLGLNEGGAGFNLTKTYPTPDAASLGTFGLIPPNPFNGQANVSIPLYTITYKDLAVPLTLSYSTAGNKVEEAPGWVGMNWSLQTGGSIYRKVNGNYDEHPKQTPQVTFTDEICYYYNCGRVASDFTNLTAIRNYALDGVTDPVVEKNNRYDAMPDEFIFNFNGYSGTFFITRPYHNGPVEIKIKPNGAYKLKAEILDIVNSVTFDDWLNTDNNQYDTRQSSRSIYKIRITDEKGIQYIFGGNANAIDFSNAGNLGHPFYTIASTWHLTEIIAPAGYKIQFAYKRAGRLYTQQKQRNITFYDGSYNFGSNTLILFQAGTGSFAYYGDLEKYVITIQNPVYLESITTPQQTVTFSSSRTNDLDYPFDIATLNAINEPDYRWGANENCRQKLNEINIPGLKKFVFHYVDQPDRRLSLNTVELQSHAPSSIYFYTFAYNPMLLPPYNSKKADHWGYYNGRAYGYNNSYQTTREPDEQYLQAEMLTTIYYPTGGYLKLEYEPHKYKKIARQFPFDIESQSSNLTAGGLRVRKITSAPNLGDIAMTREYFYVTDYLNGGTVSSGVLSGIPQYANTGSMRSSFRTGNFWSGSWGSSSVNFGKIVDNNFLTLGNTNGNHVTYSEVTEKTGQGYIVYKYTNHDNGYGDLEPYTIHTNFDSKWHEEGFISREPFRGLPMDISYFDENEVPVKSTTYEYAIDITTPYYRVPYFYRIYDASMQQATPLTRVSTGVFFTKPALTSKQIDKQYSGAANFLTTIKASGFYPDRYPSGDPLYDNFKETFVKTTGSAGEELKTTYTYPYDMVAFSRDPSGIYQGMINQNRVSEVVEEIQNKNTTQLLLTRNNYHSPHSGIYASQTVEVQKGAHAPETRFRFHTYDNLGNILTQSKENDGKTSFIWDYKQAFPVAEINNAGQNEIAYTSFEAEGTGYWTLESGATMAGGVTGTRSYTGSLSKTQLPAGNYTVTLWSNWYGTATVNGQTGTLLTTKGRWNLYQWQLTNITSVEVTGTNIDEVRLYPQQARMTTYTYTPLKGKTSECNQLNEVIYYEYDAIGRLALMRDGDRNVLKKICYYYFENGGSCNYYVNVEKSQPFTRDCGTGVGSSVTYTVPEGTYASALSQADADQQAQNDLNANGPIYANLTGICTYYNTYRTGTFTRNNCPPGYAGTSVVYVVPADTYSSLISQADADQQAQNEIDANGQQDANTRGQCRLIYYNEEYNEIFTRNDCGASYSGGLVTYTVPEGTYSSTLSQADANIQAWWEAQEFGQAYANANGTCHPLCSNCTGEGKKCIAGVCRTGTKVYTFAEPFGPHGCRLTYHYKFIDNTRSQDYYEISNNPCPVW